MVKNNIFGLFSAHISCIYLFVHLLIMCFQLKRYFFTLSSTLKSIVIVFVYKVHFSILVIWGCLDSGHK